MRLVAEITTFAKTITSAGLKSRSGLADQLPKPRPSKSNLVNRFHQRLYLPLRHVAAGHDTAIVRQNIQH